MDNIVKQSVTQVMTQDESGKGMVDFAKDTAQRLVKDGLARSQIRNIFGEVRKIEATWNEENPAPTLRRLNMLKPKLDYQTSRHREVSYLRDVLAQAINQINNTPENEQTERFHRFMNLFEAILAYHRSLGGRN